MTQELSVCVSSNHSDPRLPSVSHLAFFLLPLCLSAFPHILASPFKGRERGLPWWSNGEGSTGQRRRWRFSPWSGKTPLAEGQRSLCSRASTQQLLEPSSSETRGATGMGSPGTTTREYLPLATTRESPRAALKTQSSQDLIN